MVESYMQDVSKENFDGDDCGDNSVSCHAMVTAAMSTSRNTFVQPTEKAIHC